MEQRVFSIAQRMAGVGTPIGGKSKHISFAYNPLNGRMYNCGGDYSLRGGSYHREVWSIDIAAGQDWIKETGYCPPDKADPWPRGRCETGWSWDAKRKVFWLFSGVYGENMSSHCGYPASEGTYAYVMNFDPEKKKWSIPTQSPQPNPDWIKKHGILDAETYRLLTVRSGSSSTIYAFDIASGQWSTLASYPSYLWQRGQMTERGRKWYFVDEHNSALIAFDLTWHTFENLGKLPEDPHAEDAPGTLFAPQGLLAYWWLRDQLVYTRHYRENTIWLYNVQHRRWQKQQLNPPDPSHPIRGNCMFVDGNSGALVIGGTTKVAWNASVPYWVII